MAAGLRKFVLGDTDDLSRIAKVFTFEFVAPYPVTKLEVVTPRKR
jgi:hypothetical protein